jgi:hypothetical protein
LSLALALGLFALAVPRMLAAFAALDAETALYEANWERKPAPNDLAAGIAGLKRAVDWVPSAKKFIDLAFLELALAVSLPADSPERTQALRDAEAHSIAGLALNPADGMGWLRLALVREQLGAPARSVVDCIVLSLDVAPNRRPTWLARARLLAVYWAAMTVEERLTARRQFVTIWSAAPALRKPLVQMAGEGNWLYFLRWAIGDDPETEASFAKILQAK